MLLSCFCYTCNFPLLFAKEVFLLVLLNQRYNALGRILCVMRSKRRAGSGAAGKYVHCEEDVDAGSGSTCILECRDAVNVEGNGRQAAGETRL